MPDLRDARRARHLSDDGALLLRAKSGEDAAFAELWSRYFDYAVRSARSVTTAFDAEDLASEALARIFERLRAGGGPASEFRSYLFVSVRNLAREWARAQREYTTDDEALFEKIEATADSAPPEPADENSTLVQAFRSLPARWQEALWYTEVDGMSTAEAADALALSPNAVHQLTFRAREGLRAAWIQASLPRLASAPACRWSVERMGAYERDRLGIRDRAKFERHVRGCASCTRMVELAEREGARLRAILVPLLLAGGLGAGIGLTETQSATADTAQAPRHVAPRRRRVTTLRRFATVAVITVSALLVPSPGPVSQATSVASDDMQTHGHTPWYGAPTRAAETSPLLDPPTPVDDLRAVTPSGDPSAPAPEAESPRHVEPVGPPIGVVPPAEPVEAEPAPPPASGPSYSAAFDGTVRYDRETDLYAVPFTLTRIPGADPAAPVTLFLSPLEYYSLAGVDGAETVDAIATDDGWEITLAGASSDPATRAFAVLLKPESSSWPPPRVTDGMICRDARADIRITARVVDVDGRSADASIAIPGIGVCEL
ncbi:sigma-70 family RNA polymerase sigma factor [Microbacterium sp. NPDC055988]|uniref:sigma-70 family RNA polymerase sigma factor n=1 Tax=Microbacterium sp. NPDC055988 TaxID=3345671 RepID=UPI0035E0293E